MKNNKIKSGLIALILLLCLGQVFSAPCGDVNSSSAIDIVDALMTAQYYVGLNPAGFDTGAADVNGDKSINIIDALQIAQYYVGLINSFPGCNQTPTPTPGCNETRPASPPKGALSKVERTTWGASGVPSYVNMYIHLPGALSAKPAILVACHSCGTSVNGYYGAIPKIVAAADKNGFIVILPEATGRNCWDVGSTQSLTHDGGGDTQAVAQMVKYALKKYNGDKDRVYIMGGSSGAMMTQAMLAVYPDIFKAGSARAGVPAGCWADGYDPGNQWSGNCAGGRTTKTAVQWGSQARGMYAGYNGPRPRVQLYHGMADSTINYNNQKEAVKLWTNLLGLSETPSYQDNIYIPDAAYNYERMFWKDNCGYVVFETWSSPGNGHSMTYEEYAILAFLGLDKFSCVDPQAAACSK